MPRFRTVDARVFDGDRLDPELEQMVALMRTVTDETVAYEVSLEPGDDAADLRKRLQRAATLAGVRVSVRTAPDGWYVVWAGGARRRRGAPAARQRPNAQPATDPSDRRPQGSVRRGDTVARSATDSRGSPPSPNRRVSVGPPHVPPYRAGSSAPAVQAEGPSDPRRLAAMRWRVIPRAFVVQARAAGVVVDTRRDGFMLKTPGPAHDDLIRIKRDAMGNHAAMAAASTTARRTAHYRALAIKLNVEIDRLLVRLSDEDSQAALFTLLLGAESRFDRTRSTVPRARPRKGRASRATSNYVRILQGGAPGLGKR